MANIFFALGAQTLIQLILVTIVSSKLNAYSAQKMLDLRLFYNALDIKQYFSELGEAGRQMYFYSALLDLIYPFAYTATFVLLLAYLGKFAFRLSRYFPFVILIPFFLFLTDYLENAVVITLLKTYPDAGLFSHLAGYITLLKYGLLVSTMIALSITGLLALKKGMR